MSRGAGGRGGGDVVVSLEVEGEVVGAGEGAAARPTAERLVAGVLAVVTTQLVGAREPPLTAVPLAPERTLAYTTHTHTHTHTAPPLIVGVNAAGVAGVVIIIIIIMDIFKVA